MSILIIPEDAISDDAKISLEDQGVTVIECRNRAPSELVWLRDPDEMPEAPDYSTIGEGIMWAGFWIGLAIWLIN